MRLYDSAGTQNANKLQQSATTSATILSLQQHQQQQQRFNVTKLKQTRNYYRGEDTKNPYDYKSYKFNMEQSWNPVNNYIYGPTVNSVYNQQDKEAQTHRKLERILNINSINSRDREKIGGGGGGSVGVGGKGSESSRDGGDFDKAADFGKMKNRPDKLSNRKSLGEFVNNEAPRLCDHAIDEFRVDSIKKRHCTPLESYISTGRDMVWNFTERGRVKRVGRKEGRGSLRI